jgi:hypothetical protein
LRLADFDDDDIAAFRLAERIGELVDKQILPFDVGYMLDCSTPTT